MSKESSWVIQYPSEQSTKCIFEYLQEQATDLGQQTQGKVMAEITSSTSFDPSILATLASIATGRELGIVHKQAKDASNLYSKGTYDFYIYNKDHSYEFVLFRLKCNDLFPVHLKIDPTVASEMNYAENSNISSFETFCMRFEDMIHTNKVVYIIQKLLRMEEDDGLKEAAPPITDNDD